MSRVQKLWTLDRRALALSLLLNWLLGPLLMFTPAWVFLAELPELRTGLIIVGLARCIAMVLIWNDLACGSRELAAVLVAVNSLFQIVMYSVLGWFYLSVLPDCLYGLLFTIVVLFALQGKQITSNPLDVARVAVPLLVYFVLMWAGAFLAGHRMRFPYQRNASIAFTAAGNNFELAIAVSIAVFGVTSVQALAGTIGPLLEVPTLIALVYLSLWLRTRWYPEE